MRMRLGLPFICGALLACNDVPVAPDLPDVPTVTTIPAQQWVGNEVKVAGVFLDTIDSASANLILESEPRTIVAFKRVAADTIAFSVPSDYRPDKQLTLWVNGRLVATIELRSFGLIQRRTFGYLETEARGILPIGAGRGLMAFGPRYRTYNLNSSSFEAASFSQWPLLDPPGASAQPGRMAGVYRNDSGQLQPASYLVSGGGRYDLPCGPLSPYPYYLSLVELSDTSCISIDFETMVRNGIDTIASGRGLRVNLFKTFPALNRVFLVSRDADLSDRGDLATWPVLDLAGNVVESLDRYRAVASVDYDASQNRLLVSARVSEDSGEQFQIDDYVVDILDPANLAIDERIEFPTGFHVRDVAYDPLNSLVYMVVSPRVARFDTPSTQLFVYDRDLLELVANIDLAPYDMGPGDIVIGGPNDLVHFMGQCGVDCGLHHATVNVPR